jgi:hypothetical protein
MPRYVYFVRAVGTGRYKIGLSDHPAKRIVEMQVGSPIELELVHKVECRDAAKSERRVHNVAKPFRSHGEWFDLSRADYERIVAELEKFERGEPSALDSVESLPLERIKTDGPRRKGTLWVEYTCLDCGRTKCAGDESQSAANHVCYACWTKRRRASWRLINEFIRRNDAKADIVDEIVKHIKESPSGRLVLSRAGFWTTPETPSHDMVGIGKVPDWYCSHAMLRKMERQGKLRRCNRTDNPKRDDRELNE